MNVTIPPELAKFIEDEVRAGRFATPAEVVEAGLARLMLDAPLVEGELDAETTAAIQEADGQIDRGEGVDLEAAFAELRAKHVRPKSA